MNFNPEVLAVVASLYQGNTVRLTFSSKESRDSFRKSVYNCKRQQDEAMSELLGEKPKVLRVHTPPTREDGSLSPKDDELDNYPFKMEMWLERKALLVAFEVIEREKEQKQQSEQAEEPQIKEENG